LVRAVYLSAFVVAMSTWGAISSVRPLPFTFNVLEFLNETYPAKSRCRRIRLLYGENCIIFNRFWLSIHPCDRRTMTNRQTDERVLSRAKNWAILNFVRYVWVLCCRCSDTAVAVYCISWCPRSRTSSSRLSTDTFRRKICATLKTRSTSSSRRFAQQIYHVV